MRKKGNIRNWILAAHPWSFPASAMPALVAVSYVFYLSRTGEVENVNWLNGVIALLGAIIFQASGHLISDYSDYKYGVDREEPYGSSRMLVDKVLEPETILRFGFTLLLAGIVLGICLFTRTGLPLLFIGFIGVLGTVFYSKLKFMTLGDVLIFVLFGLLISLGTVYVMTNLFLWKILLVTTPVGFLIVNILHVNYARDIIFDKRTGIRTQAISIGLEGSQIAYQSITLASYVVVAIVIMLGVLHVVNFLVLLTFPLAMKNVKQMKTADMEHPERIKDLDTASVRLVTMFSVCMVIANCIAIFL